MNMINVAIADDQVLFRKGMVSIINAFKNIQVIIEAENGKDLLNTIEEAVIRPDVILLDLSMPELNGVETTKILQQKYSSIKIIILSIHSEERFVTHLMELGVNGYLFKNVEPIEVEKALRAVVEKDFYFNETFLRAMQNRISGKKRRFLIQDDIPSTLTQRELDVLDLICKQHTTQEIADKLFISVRTVDGHRNNLLEKTGMRNTAGLVVFSIKNNLLDPSTLL
ncbi:two component transcriptional regulator, LuxR family [Emticicia oligotrophica DSM 17448]|uniref:Two component transcriptional regulator, LuxR family n=1 Tax=Emticicia oligotrophica (strain DSM 17448 / CIP 109782 / MTCC 6937 / GPTSA100-15) TaxID=929562 RepID=A0ABM5MWW1_EMTOG|nr:response regulator transcription factor [Emticicia oligotrophica]AFK01507.1 two component transcriptional regulator, LuxR family [Emticicia oligotrophica DSM 17448]